MIFFPIDIKVTFFSKISRKPAQIPGFQTFFTSSGRINPPAVAHQLKIRIAIRLMTGTRFFFSAR